MGEAEAAAVFTHDLFILTCWIPTNPPKKYLKHWRPKSCPERVAWARSTSSGSVRFPFLHRAVPGRHVGPLSGPPASPGAVPVRKKRGVLVLRWLVRRLNEESDPSSLWREALENHLYMFGVRLNMIEQHLGSFTLFWGLLPGQQILESPGR